MQIKFAIIFSGINFNEKNIYITTDWAYIEDIKLIVSLIFKYTIFGIISKSIEVNIFNILKTIHKMF